MENLKVKQEIQEMHGNSSVSTLKALIFLTKALKNLHTKGAIFIAIMMITYSVALPIYFSTGNISILFFGIFAHFLGFSLTLYLYKRDKEGGFDKTYKELAFEQLVLEEMLANKK